GAPLRKAWMGEHENCHTAGSQNSVEGFHGPSKVRDIHENVVREHHVKALIIDCAKLGAGIQSEVDIGMLRARDLDHSLGEVNASNKRAPVAEFLRQIPGTATCVEHREPAYVAREFPQH